MRVALLYLGRRGSGPAFTLQLAHAMSSQVDARAFISAYAENLSSWQGSDLNYVALPTFRNGFSAVQSTLFRFRLDRIEDEIRTFAPDVLLVCMFHPWNGLLQRRLASIPSVVIVHDPQPHPGLVPLLHRWGEDYSLHEAQIAVVLSQNLIPELTRRGISEQKIRVAHHGLLSVLQKNIAPSLPGLDRKQALFFGRITRYKGLEILLKAWPGVKEAVPNAELIIAGSGSLAPYRRALTQCAGVQIKNYWVDERETDLLFEQANLVVVPYTSASQSGIVLLAAEKGRAVIASRVGGLPEQIEEGRSGVLVEPGDVQGLSRAITDLFQHPERACELGGNLWSDYRDRYSWPVIAGDILDACRQAIQDFGGKK